MSQVQTLDRDGRSVSYEVEGEGPIGLVLVTEPGRERVLSVVAHYLAEEAGFHVVTVHPGDPSDNSDHTRDAILSVLDAVDMDDAWIGGHGAGGSVARRFVAAHPERANGLLLLGVEEVEGPLAPAIPILVIQGEADAELPTVNGERFQQLAPERINVRTLAGADHLFPLNHPIETATIIEEYLDWD